MNKTENSSQSSLINNSFLTDRKKLSGITPPLNISALDSRYRAAAEPFIDDLSEAALNRYRLLIEVEWFIFLAENKIVDLAVEPSAEQKKQLREIYTSFNANDIKELQEIEKETIHDVKAVEYFLKRRIKKLGLDQISELVHFGCTSEDINNLAYALGIYNAVHSSWLPKAEELLNSLTQLAENEKNTAMLSHTHGQPATPTTLGKEIAVTAYRLQRQLRNIKETDFLGKINGATGTYAAHQVCIPTANWQKNSENFVTSLGLMWNPLTTQIESHDWQAELYSSIAHFNRILHNFATDIWMYISMKYFAQIPVEGATGSSTMPHKINPIRFENAEANIEVSNSLFDVLEQTLVTSRLQRDLTDSSMQRNIGIAFGHSLLAINNIIEGLKKLSTNYRALEQDLNNNWEVLAEAIQMVMRTEAIRGNKDLENPYEKLKELTRGEKIDKQKIHEFISRLSLPDTTKKTLLELTPEKYIGLAPELVEQLKK